MDMDFRLPALQKLQGEPIYLQLYRRFRDAIAEGKLRPGDRVPSVRSLASELNLARGTVERLTRCWAAKAICWPGGLPAPWCRPGWQTALAVAHPRSGRVPRRPRGQR